MKKQLLLLAMILLPMVASAHDIEVQNADGVIIYYNYTNNGTELEVTYRGSYGQYSNEYKGNIVIPEKVTYMNSTCKVTSIGNSAFSDCSHLTSISVPYSVTSIGTFAFSGCSALSTVNIPNQETSIGGKAFYGTAWYNNQPDGLIYVGKVAYRYKGEMPSNTVIVLQEGTTEISTGAFDGCSNLIDIYIPNSVKHIGYETFFKCSGLTSITIPNSVVSIRGDAFFGCSSLTSVTIPDAVTTIEYRTFSNCSSLTSVIIPNAVTSISKSAFEYCDNLTSVTVYNETPITIEYETFSNRKNATLYVPAGCISAYAAAYYWKEFKEIIEIEAVEVTDVSNMANAIYVEPLKGSAGSDVNIEVKLKNANSITSYGFELVLPAGVTISTSTDGDFDDAVTMSTRHKGHTLTTNKLANNTYKVGVASLSSKALTDNDGVVLTIKAHVDDNIAEGEYAIGVQSPLIVDTDGTKPAVQSTQSKITIEDYTKGDVDGDGVIDLADAVLVINHYVGKPVAKFNEKAADVDGDGVIDLADAVRIINFYVGKVQSLAPSLEFDGLDPQ